MNFFPLAFLTVLICGQIALVLGATVTVYPEFFFLPWLISKNLVPYRDFFDHHGPLLYYLLAPLSRTHNPGLVIGVYILILSAITAITFVYVRKSAGGITAVVISMISVGLMYLFSENMIWYEHFIALILLLLYAALDSGRKKSTLCGILIMLATLIKPNTAVFVIPAYLALKSAGFLLPVTAGWLLLLFTYTAIGGIGKLLGDLVLFNIRYPALIGQAKPPLKLISLSGITLLMAMLLIAGKTILSKKMIWKSVFLGCAVLLIYPKYEKISFIPLVALMPVYLSDLLQHFLTRTTLTLLVAFLILISGLVPGQLAQNRKIQPYAGSTEARNRMTVLRKIIRPAARFIVMGNLPEIYYELDSLPLVRYPLVFSWIRTFYPAIDGEYAQQLAQNRPDYVIVPLPEDPNFADFPESRMWINTNYKLILENDSVRIYKGKYIAVLN